MDKLIHAINQLTAALNQATISLQTDTIQNLSSPTMHTPELQTNPLHVESPVTKSESSCQSQSPTMEQNPLVQTKDKASTNTEHSLPEAICAWFRKYQLGFVQFNRTNANTERTRQLSLHIARHHNDVERLMSLLNQWASGSRTLNLNMRNKAVEVIAQTTNVANQMNDIGFLQHYQYKRSPHCFLRVQSNGLPATQSYLKGKWFELAIEQQLTEMKGVIPELEWISNPVIRTTKGQQREVDFIVSLHGEIYVIEASTSAWQKKATQVLSLANQLQLPIKQCLIISPDHEPELMKEFSDLHGASVLSFEQFSHWIDQHSPKSNTSSGLDNVVVMESCVL